MEVGARLEAVVDRLEVDGDDVRVGRVARDGDDVVGGHHDGPPSRKRAPLAFTTTTSGAVLVERVRAPLRTSTVSPAT